jgi:putative photosynthetic complex assembly protein 2
VALVVTAAAVVALTWGAPNPVAGATFLVLLFSRLSAKLNLFLGVPNFTEAFFPDHLRYLTSYLRRGPASALFPVSILAGVTLAAVLARRALDPDATLFAVTGASLVFTLTALALLEHAFMVLRLPDAALWRWAAPDLPNPLASDLTKTTGAPRRNR